MVNVWRLIAFQDKGCRRQLVIQWAINNERIAIGWGRIGNLGQYATEQDILAAAQNYLCPQQYPQDKPLQKCVRSCWKFREMQPGDLVVYKGNDWGGSKVMRVKGPYEYVCNPPGEQPPYYDYQHQRKIQVTCIDPYWLWNEAGKAPGEVVFDALIRCQFPVECQGGQVRRVNDT